jgi:hypothetical protein
VNRAALHKHVRRLLAEAGQAMFPDDAVNDQLNRSARALAQQHALLRRRVTLDTDDSGAATLPDDTAAVLTLWDNVRRWHLMAVSAEYAPFPGEVTETGYATAYSYDPAWGSKLTVYPARALGLTADLLVTGPAMTTDADVPWGGQYETYHDVISLHAAYHLGGYAGGGNAAVQGMSLQRYQLRMEEFKSAMAIRAIDGPSMQVVGVQPRRRRRGYL